MTNIYILEREYVANNSTSTLLKLIKIIHKSNDYHLLLLCRIKEFIDDYKCFPDYHLKSDKLNNQINKIETKFYDAINNDPYKTQIYLYIKEIEYNLNNNLEIEWNKFKLIIEYMVFVRSDKILYFAPKLDMLISNLLYLDEMRKFKDLFY